jgi:hypothetical protein
LFRGSQHCGDLGRLFALGIVVVAILIRSVILDSTSGVGSIGG